MSCKIEFEKYQDPFIAGTSIKGKVVCSLTSSEDTRGVRIKLIGQETYKTDDHHKTIRFLRTKHFLMEEGSLGPGVFHFPFSFHLPDDLPTTYRGFYGGVAYRIEAKVDRPFKIDHTDSKVVQVFSPIKLASLRSLKLSPTWYTATKDISSWFSHRGTINMEINMQKEAFARGEAVIVNVNLFNASSIDVRGLRVNIKTKLLTRSYENAREIPTYKLLSSVTSPGVEPQAQKKYNVSVQIPYDAEIPNFSRCKLYSCTGMIEVIAILPTFHLNLVFDREIVLGHIPIREQVC